MRRPRITKRRLAGAAAVLAAAASVGVWTLTRAGASAQTTPLVVTVSRGTIQQTVSTTGTITPAHQADAAFTVSGTVTSVPVSVGDTVDQGQTLATIDDSQLATAADLASAKVTAAEDAVTAAASASASQQAAAEAQLASARNALSQAQAAVKAATLTSPISGTVASVGISVGDTVGSGAGASSARSGSTGTSSATGSGSSSAETITVISTNAWQVDGTVGAADLPSLKKGLQAQIVPDGTSTKIFGTVSTVGIMATSSSSGTATFPVTIAVTGHPKGLYAGTSASVSIIIKQASNVLTVPTGALTSQGGTTYVMRWVKGTEVRTKVTVGTVYGPSTQITSGLSDGDQVVLTRRRPSGSSSTGTSGGQQGRTGRFPGGFGGGGFGGGFGGRGGAGG